VGPAPIPAPFAYYAFGDSITSGDYANAPQLVDGYVGLIAQDLGLLAEVNSQALETNFGLGGAQSEDIANIEVFGNSPGYSHVNPGIIAPLFTLMVGTNEAESALSSEAVFHTTHLATLSWLSIPSPNKTFAQACAQTAGDWTPDTTYLTGVGMNSTTNGSVLNCGINSYGGPIYAWIRVINSNGGQFTYSLDGGPAQSANAYTTPAICSGDGTTQSVGFLRIPNVAFGTHSLTFTVTSATSPNNLVGILAIGTPSPIAYWNQPTVFSAGVPYQLADAKSQATAMFNADAQSDQQLLYNDGLPVFFVDVRKYVGSTAAEITNSDGMGVHLTQLGHNELAAAFEAQMKASRSNLLQ
jgi:hypothetical protein